MAKYLILILVLSGCGNLRPDGSTAANTSNYPTAEITCNGEKFNGLGICMSPAHIEFQGYGTGTIRIDSERCQLQKSVTYSNNAIVAVDVNPPTGCLIDVTMSPVGMSSMIGRLYVKTLSNATYDRFVDKVPTTVDHVLQLKASGISRVILQGCGARIDQNMAPSSGIISISLNSLNPNSNQCLFEGAVITNGEVHRFGWQAWIYDKSFNPLAEPEIQVTQKKISILAPSEVSIISWDSQYKMSNEATFNNDSSSHILRLITIKGRLLLGTWDGKEFTWIK